MVNIETESSFFRNAIEASFASLMDHSQYEIWRNYALSTNERGQQVITKLKEFSPSLVGKRHLDIGCGYGGTCIAAALSGATSIGIEYDPRIFEFAIQNKKDFPDANVDFYQLDIMDWQQVQSLDKFDLITCDNVIEHVAMPERLIYHLRMLLDDKGFAYITIPNAFSIGQVRKDCHYGLWGISLLDRWDAALYVKHAIMQPSYDVSSYYSYDQYRNLFQKYGLQDWLINTLELDETTIQRIKVDGDSLESEFQQTLASGKIPVEIVQKLSEMVHGYSELLATSITYYEKLPSGSEKRSLGIRLLRDYREELWYVIAARQVDTFFPKSTLSLPKRILQKGKKLLRLI